MAEKKARELENFESKSIQLKPGEEASAAQVEQDQGEQVIDSYLREFTNKNVGSMSPQDLRQYLSNLKQRLEKESNPYVRQVLVQGK